VPKALRGSLVVMCQIQLMFGCVHWQRTPPCSSLTCVFSSIFLSNVIELRTHFKDSASWRIPTGDSTDRIPFLTRITVSVIDEGKCGS
jgi:hypothetical protein